MSRVGALISAFYCEKYLAARITNLLEQQPRPEILAVCLRSSAEYDILQEFPEVVRFPWATVPTIYGAWNDAILHTSADYLVTANSDDFFYPGALQSMQMVLDENPSIALVYPDADISREYGGMVVGRYQLPEFDVMTMLDHCYMGPMPMWRRSLHDTYGLFDSQMEVAGDYDFWLRTALQGEKFLHLPVAVGCYLSRPDSREHREHVRTLWETARAKSRYVKEAYGPEEPNSEASLDASHDSVPVSGTQEGAASD